MVHSPARKRAWVLGLSRGLSFLEPEEESAGEPDTDGEGRQDRHDPRRGLSLAGDFTRLEKRGAELVPVHVKDPPRFEELEEGELDSDEDGYQLRHLLDGESDDRPDDGPTPEFEAELLGVNLQCHTGRVMPNGYAFCGFPARF